jgi:serine/threonine-protein kinase RsbW
VNRRTKGSRKTKSHSCRVSCAPYKGGLKLPRTGWLLRLELPSDPEVLCVVRSAMMRLSEKLGFPAEECRALTRAVDEALANIIRHAYGGRRGQPIELLCRRMKARTDRKQQAGLEIVLVDHGAAADGKALRGRSLDDIRPGGLGLHFIQGGVDVMQYKSQAGKNRLRLLKYLPAARSEPRSAKGE